MNYTDYKYLLFAFDSHESYGGMEDLVFKFNTLDEFKDDFIYKDLYIYQLVDTKDFSFKEFSSNIIYRVGTDDYSLIKSKREIQLLKWIESQL